MVSNIMPRLCNGRAWRFSCAGSHARVHLRQAYNCCNETEWAGGAIITPALTRQIGPVMPRKSTSTLQRFMAKVDTRHPSGCWVWMAGTDGAGYGMFYLQGRDHQAHRVAYRLFVGEITDSLCVLHDCPAGDNPLCVNPAHLWLGTKGDNARDREAKGRGRVIQGERNGNAKLTEDTVRDIRTSIDSNVAAARRHGVSADTISVVRRRITWGHVPD